MDDKKTAATITLIKGGPMVITGSFGITSSDGTQLTLTPEQKKTGVAICRCGRTKNTPFCDGSHTR